MQFFKILLLIAWPNILWPNFLFADAHHTSCKKYECWADTQCLTVCPPNSYESNGQCFCYVGYQYQNGACVPIVKVVKKSYTKKWWYKYWHRYNPNKCYRYSKYKKYLCGKSCVKRCPKYSSYNKWRICQCKPNYNLYKGKCYCRGFYFDGKCILECPPNSYQTTWKTCKCNWGYEIKNGQCVLPEVTPPPLTTTVPCCPPTPYLFGNICVATCPSGSTLTADNKCVCHPFWIPAGNQCICADSSGLYCVPPVLTCQPPTPYICGSICVTTCPPNSSLSGSTCYCHKNYIPQNNQCVCSGGFFNGVCLATCPPFSTLTNGNCVCNAGYTQNGNVCQPNCPANSTFNPTTQTCVCNTGYVAANGACVQLLNCPPNSTFNPTTQTCVCNTGYEVSGTVCIPKCPVNTTYNPTTKTCECNTGFELHCGKCKPVCPANSTWKCSQKKCVCNEGYVQVGDECQTLATCPPNSTLNPTTNTCECNTGYKKFEDTCVSICPVNSTFNPANGCCECNTGYEPKDGKCQPKESSGCPLNSTIQPDGSCVCNTGYTKVGEECVILSQPLTCPDGKYADNGECKPCHASCANCSGAADNQCTECGEGKFLWAGKCQAATPCTSEFAQYLFDHACVASCPANSTANAAKVCTCNAGYLNHGTECVNVCPSGTTPNTQTGYCV